MYGTLGHYHDTISHIMNIGTLNVKKKENKNKNLKIIFKVKVS